jgi:ribulose 1,5-bisphosphate synthetase/thiazole synthase
MRLIKEELMEKQQEKCYEVVIAGGGPAGIVAAIAAARNGAKTLLVERYGFLGGQSSASLVYPWMSFHDSLGNQVIQGIAQEIVDRLVAMGGSPGHVPDTVGYVSMLTPFDVEAFKYLAQEMVLEAGAELLLHTWITDAAIEDGLICALGAVNESGRATLRGSIFIDATGDADVAQFAGAEMAKGRDADGATQPMTMNFRLGGVDLERVRGYMQDQPGDFYSGTRYDLLKALPRPTGVQGFYSIWKGANLPIPRDQVLFFAGMRPGEVGVNTSRIVGLDATNADDLTTAEVEGRRQVMMLVQFFRERVPGFADCYLIATPAQVGVRETRRIVGHYVLTRDDVTGARRFSDGIARSAYPIDIHDPKAAGNVTFDVKLDHDIPYRCLLPRGVRNLLAAGRIISVTHEAFAAIRVTPPVMAIGQAAGAAAALCVRHGILPGQVNVRELQDLLVSQGASLVLGQGEAV